MNPIKLLTSDLLLAHYDLKLPIIIAADASQSDIVAALLHQFPNGHQKAVMHVSRALSSDEKSYSQILKEGLAIVFAVTKFHKMLQIIKLCCLFSAQRKIFRYIRQTGFSDGQHTASRIIADMLWKLMMKIL